MTFTTPIRAAGLCVLLTAFLLSGCGRAQIRGPYATATEQNRDPAKSRELASQAKAARKSDPAKCEDLLRQALSADLYNGAAHNNLGVLLLERGELYSASEEFQWARRLLPGHPDPRVNLALTLEKAGKTDDAIDAYNSALAVYDNYLPALEGKARRQIATGRTDKSTLTALDEIALRGDEAWRDWAMLWKAKLAAREP